MAKLGWPTLFCHHLSVAADGTIEDYHLRQPDSKRCVVQAMKALQYEVISVGDSYNDISMLEEADHGFLFRPPDNVKAEYPQYPVSYSYEELKGHFEPLIDGGAT
jgi:phosphoserine/homoserine phosphotransferase